MEATPKAVIAGPATQVYGSRLQWAGGLPAPWKIILAAAGVRHRSVLQRPIHPGEPPFRTDWIGGGVMLGCPAGVFGAGAGAAVEFGALV